MKKQWLVQENIRWCWLELGGVALMLQQLLHSASPADAPEETKLSEWNAQRSARDRVLA